MSGQDQQGQAKTISFDLPNGVRIMAELCGDADTPLADESGWSSIDIYAEFPSGHREYLCCVDFETKDGNPGGYDLLRVMTYKPGDEHPDTITKPLPHRSIWLSLDEGTYDVNVWDDDLDTRDEFLEVGHIPTLEEAERMMNQIIQCHSFIWTKREMQIA